LSQKLPTYEEFKEWENKGWSTWLPLDEKSIKEVPEFPGTYEVRTKDYSFPRLRGVTSILYVGCTDQRGLKVRIEGLIKGRHIASKRIQKVVDELERELEFRFKVDMQAKQVEKQLLQEYEAKHLELPPCNHSLPKS
jgi:hypothetical protein